MTHDASTMRLTHRQILLVWSLFLVALLAGGLRDVHSRWPTIGGAECEWIALPLAEGHGYSFTGQHRWLFFGESPEDEHFPTAWLPPVYPMFMAACFATLGDQGRLVIASFQVLAFILTCVMVYHVGRMVVGPWTGLLAGTLLAVLPAAVVPVKSELSNSPFAGLLVCVYAIAVLWCLRNVTARRGIVVGAVIAVSVQTYGATLLFGPIAVLAVLVTTRFRTRGWTTSVVITATCLAVMSPWMVRNFVVFGELVPSRTGMGFNAYMCNNLLAETVRPELAAGPGAPAWTAEDDWDAIYKARTRDARLQLYVRAFECLGVSVGDGTDRVASPSAPPGFVDMNEPQRDRVYLREYGAFVRSHPGLAASFAVKKGLSFFGAGRPVGGWGRGKLAISLAALLGVLVAVRNPRIWLLVAMVLGFIVPYCIGLPFFFRYRYPVEPILLLLSSHLIVVMAGAGYRVLERSQLGRRLLHDDRDDGAA